VTDHNLTAREHPIREFVHFPGVPGVVSIDPEMTPEDTPEHGEMVETTAPEFVESPPAAPHESRASISVTLPATFGTPTVTQDPPPGGPEETVADAPEDTPKRRRK
jgi:hypothetical protein